MKLLCFAHKGEARWFLNSKFQKVETNFANLYKSTDAYLLITGEGVQFATESVSAVCAYFQNEINEIHNFGIAGSLDPRLEVGSIHKIRYVFRNENGKIQKRSFLCDEKSQMDIITVDETVSDQETSDRYFLTASLVDKELWGIASVAKRFSLKLCSTKVISDYAGSATPKEEIIKNAKNLSHKLFEYYSSMIKR